MGVTNNPMSSGIENKETSLKVRAGNTPKELRAYNNWVCWKYCQRDSGKSGKMPLTAEEREPASPIDSETWSNFERAEAAGATSNIEETDGIGFVFSEEDPFVGIDLDDCVENGEIKSWAMELIERFNSYTELSPSGTGVHIITRGELPEGGNRNNSLEMYDTERFFTVTGQHLEGTPVGIKSAQDELEDIHSSYISSEEGDSQGEALSKNTRVSGNDLGDDQVLEKARAAKKGEKFQRLWNGDIGGYDSHSEADQALCCRLAFWTAGDTTQMERLFRKSGLMRKKWDENRGDQTYGQITVETAVSEVDEFYTPGNSPSKNELNIGPSNTGCDQVQQVVTENFGARTWDLTEAALATQATLLLDVDQNTGLVFVGNSGAGKTTVLRFFEGFSRVLRSDDATPASFVSADASLSEEDLEENDLLPRVQHKTLLCRDMATWFSGDKESIRQKMSVLAHLMDGEGYARDTGSHGRRGYTGDYRFNFLGATTPLPARSWAVMGHTGNRFVFHKKQSSANTDDVVDDVFGESDYGKKVDKCRSAVQDLLENIWHTHGGYSSVQWSHHPSSDIKQVFAYLSKLVVYARAPITEGTPQQEGPHRIMTTLRDIARGRALLDGRTELCMADVGVCARVALSTMPRKRRPVVRALLDPENKGTLTAKEVISEAGISRPTAHTRMAELDTLEMADCIESDDDGRNPKTIECYSEFKWPDTLAFPVFEEESE